MRTTASTSSSSSKTSTSVGEVTTRETTTAVGDTQVKTKCASRAKDHDVVTANGVGGSFPSTSASPRSPVTFPVGAKELQHAPLLDECVERLCREMEDVVKPSPSFRTTRIRGLLNSKNGFVSALRLSTVQAVFARYVTMNDLAAIANTCSAIAGSLNLGDEKSRKMWVGIIKKGQKGGAGDREAYYKALENMPEPCKRRRDDDEEVPYAPPWRPQSRGPKRVKGVISISVDG